MNVITIGMMVVIIFAWGFGGIPTCPSLESAHIDAPITSGMM